jgi:hypothetical protein
MVGMFRASRPGLACALVLIGACGTAPPPSHSGATLPKPPKPWGELNLLERKQHMNAHVLPAMEARFKRFDGVRYANFSCATCHGSDMVARNFAMPNPSLLALHATGSPEQQRMVRERPEMTRFMFNQVLPGVQAMLDAPDYDPATRSGFSCYACHPSAAAGALKAEN